MNCCMLRGFFCCRRVNSFTRVEIMVDVFFFLPDWIVWLKFPVFPVACFYISSCSSSFSMNFESKIILSAAVRCTVFV